MWGHILLSTFVVYLLGLVSLLLLHESDALQIRFHKPILLPTYLSTLNTTSSEITLYRHCSSQYTFPWEKREERKGCRVGIKNIHNKLHYPGKWKPGVSWKIQDNRGAPLPSPHNFPQNSRKKYYCRHRRKSEPSHSHEYYYIEISIHLLS